MSTAPTAPLAVLGIDIAKATFDVALLLEKNSTPKHRTFKNNDEGFRALQQWLVPQLPPNQSADALKIHACMEATGTYGDALARYLVAQGHKVSVVNPAATQTPPPPKPRRHPCPAATHAPPPPMPMPSPVPNLPA